MSMSSPHLLTNVAGVNNAEQIQLKSGDEALFCFSTRQERVVVP